jgi:hypothetical protein
MDEEDGRPGALAAQTGHLDATDDVPTPSLRPRQSDPLATLKTVILSIPSDKNVGNHEIWVPQVRGLESGFSDPRINPTSPNHL